MGCGPSALPLLPQGVQPHGGRSREKWLCISYTHVGIVSLILVDKRAEHLGLWCQLPRERIGAPAHKLAAAHIKGLEVHDIPYPVIAKNVLITLLHGRHVLLAYGFLRGSF